MYLGRNGGATLGTERVRVQDAWPTRESEPVNMVLQSPELRVAKDDGVPAGCRGKKPMYGIAATHGVLRGQRAPGRIMHAQYQIHRRTKPLGGGIAHDDIAGLGFEGPDVDILAWEDAAIGGDGKVTACGNGRPSISSSITSGKLPTTNRNARVAPRRSSTASSDRPTAR